MPTSSQALHLLRAFRSSNVLSSIEEGQFHLQQLEQVHEGHPGETADCDWTHDPDAMIVRLPNGFAAASDTSDNESDDLNLYNQPSIATDENTLSRFSTESKWANQQSRLSQGNRLSAEAVAKAATEARERQVAAMKEAASAAAAAASARLRAMILGETHRTAPESSHAQPIHYRPHFIVTLPPIASESPDEIEAQATENENPNLHPSKSNMRQDGQALDKLSVNIDNGGANAKSTAIFTFKPEQDTEDVWKSESRTEDVSSETAGPRVEAVAEGTYYPLENVKESEAEPDSFKESMSEREQFSYRNQATCVELSNEMLNIEIPSTECAEPRTLISQATDQPIEPVKNPESEEKGLSSHVHVSTDVVMDAMNDSSPSKVVCAEIHDGDCLPSSRGFHGRALRSGDGDAAENDFLADTLGGGFRVGQNGRFKTTSLRVQKQLSTKRDHLAKREEQNLSTGDLKLPGSQHLYVETGGQAFVGIHSFDEEAGQNTWTLEPRKKPTYTFAASRPVSCRPEVLGKRRKTEIESLWKSPMEERLKVQEKKRLSRMSTGHSIFDLSLRVGKGLDFGSVMAVTGNNIAKHRFDPSSIDIIKSYRPRSQNPIGSTQQSQAVLESFRKDVFLPDIYATEQGLQDSLVVVENGISKESHGDHSPLQEQTQRCTIPAEHQFLGIGDMSFRIPKVIYENKLDKLSCSGVINTSNVFVGKDAVVDIADTVSLGEHDQGTAVYLTQQYKFIEDEQKSGQEYEIADTLRSLQEGGELPNKDRDADGFADTKEEKEGRESCKDSPSTELSRKEKTLQPEVSSSNPGPVSWVTPGETDKSFVYRNALGESASPVDMATDEENFFSMFSKSPPRRATEYELPHLSSFLHQKRRSIGGYPDMNSRIERSYLRDADDADKGFKRGRLCSPISERSQVAPKNPENINFKNSLLPMLNSSTIRMRRELPLPRPNRLCFRCDLIEFTHAEIKEELEAGGKVKVTMLQYDPVYLQAHLDQMQAYNRPRSMWVFEVSSQEDTDRLLTTGFRLRRHKVKVRRVDDVYAEEHKALVSCASVMYDYGPHRRLVGNRKERLTIAATLTRKRR